jgi:predicted ATPase
MEIQKVVITGGPYSGKTTLVRHLEAQGFSIVPEAAIEVIKELNHKLGIDEQKRWRKTHVAEFQFMVAKRQAEQEARTRPENGNMVFCDRGQYDAIAYFRYYDTPISEEIRLFIEETTYAQVFILDTLTTFSQRPETGRTSNRMASLRIRGLLEEVYRQYGYEPIHVPECSVQERVSMIRQHLKLSVCSFRIE